MTTRRQAVLVATALLATLCSATRLPAQVDQRALVPHLLGDNVAERSRALGVAESIGPEHVSPELRAALIALLEKENRIVAEARRRKMGVATLENPEFIARVAHVVSQLEDPQAIPALAGALGSGSTLVSDALADFGEQAAPAVLGVVTSPESPYSVVDQGLITLRFMVEGAGTHPLSAGTREEIRRVAEHYLTTPERPPSVGVTLRWAIDLAVVLKDPGLRRIVEALASDPNEVIARGVTDPQLIATTQKLAADRLAGVPAAPPPARLRPPLHKEATPQTDE
jgi:hypothetical protein